MNVSFDKLGLVGRLGNALYELAATAGIAHTMGVEPRFNTNWIHRPYFSVPDRYFTDNFAGCVQADRTHLAQHIDERARVYLQDWNLFKDVVPTLREWLQPSRLAEEIMAADPQVAEFRALPHPILAVHVRRGDNVYDPGTPNKHLWHPVPSLAYYQRAIEMLASDAASIAVFGDDPEWNTANIPGDYHHVGVVRPKEHEPDYLTAEVSDWLDWQLIVRADASVVSNSTYGIMAAIIGDHDHVVYPWPIFGPNLRYVNASLMVPAEWQRLDYNHMTVTPR